MSLEVTQGTHFVCLNYHSFWLLLGVLQALKYRHRTVAISSLGSVSDSTVMPVLGSYPFAWALHSRATLPWPDTYLWQVALVDRHWTYVTVALLGAAWFCSIVLLSVLPSRAAGLSGDVRGIDGISSLLPSQEDSYRELGLDAADSRLTTLKI
ncbi:hypothetical protein BJ170DRAFT_605892 [Xylariales sp. AK1849]|nr:hypothetical protein BJ170DRAFT_605892 [Xylariales sp. AK1849]